MSFHHYSFSETLGEAHGAGIKNPLANRSEGLKIQSCLPPEQPDGFGGGSLLDWLNQFVDQCIFHDAEIINSQYKKKQV
ncbi:hypothetical protein ID858_07480 [Xenorhabdus sp. DI]|uniref:hypothetical protein n=1 Tax=Xenorhabdus doucetiae TaxID=351671 RepID=UPI0019CD04A0|nr:MULTISPECIES: hypothetical protein [unclassified Xenorhabdus]MBD2784556.1 hypothetical protein [Xenorhabdus sp. 3]MBD2788347.1 hypothetical protein [Xenorhabdus sp. DI]